MKPWNKGKKGGQVNKYKGKKIPWIGHAKPHSEETKKRISEAKKKNPTRYWLGKKHSLEHRKKISLAKKGFRHTEENKKKYSQLWKGERNPRWKGGITPINMALRHSLEYKIWHRSVFERDNWTCVWCGQRGGDLEADHIKPFAYYPELRFAIDNGRTLCKKCHNTTKWGRSTNKIHEVQN